MNISMVLPSVNSEYETSSPFREASTFPKPCHNQISSRHPTRTRGGNNFNNHNQYSKGEKIMNSSVKRIILALLVAFLLIPGAVSPARAQSSPPAGLVDVRLLMQDGWQARGRHSVAKDFVLVCPNQEVLDPEHPCSNSNTQMHASGLDDIALVCPSKEVLDPSHPCANRRSQVLGATPDDYVLVCPVKEVLDPQHPCAKHNSGAVKFKIPGNYVMTCPVKEVLEPGHPCADN
jgi:hypothetical protein